MSAPAGAATAEQRDEFRRYLERKRVTHLLTETLTDLFEMEDRPEDPLAYLHKKLGDKIAGAARPPAPPAAAASAQPAQPAPPASAQPAPSPQLEADAPPAP